MSQRSFASAEHAMKNGAPQRMGDDAADRQRLLQPELQ